MKIEIKSSQIKKSRFFGEIEMPFSEFSKVLEEVTNDFVKDAQLPGFRKGKAPRSLVIQNLNPRKLHGEALTRSLPKIITEISEREGIKPISIPEVKVLNFAKEEGVKMEISFDIWPKFELRDYQKIKIRKRPRPISEKEIEKVLLRLQRSRAQYISVSRPAKLGDFVEIEFTGSIKGERKEELSSKRYPLFLGDNTLLPQLELAIVGLKRGERKHVSIESRLFGGKYGESKIDFDLHLLEVQEVKLPELNYEFALAFGKKSIPDLKAEVKKELTLQAEKEAEMAADEEFIRELLKLVNFEVPQSLVSQVLGEKVERIKEDARKANLSFEDYLAILKIDEKGLIQALLPKAEEEASLAVLVSEIVKKEKLEIPEEKSLIRELRIYLNKL